jgi:hypothetical protein
MRRIVKTVHKVKHGKLNTLRQEMSSRECKQVSSLLQVFYSTTVAFLMTFRNHEPNVISVS